MCGIAGIVGNGRAEDPVRRMLGALRHRGPDGEGLYVDDGIVLGHRRLAILDLSDAGSQPMTSRDGRWTIVLNGEIFNYLAMRSELPGEFRTETDTEVLLKACATWGVEKALERSIGMFAFALWDARDRQLTLVRDRVGEKSLVYYTAGKTLAFASELKALRGLHEDRMDPVAVDAYLALGYVPAPLSIFRGCQKLAPGHLLKWKDGTISLERWWFPERAATPRNRSLTVTAQQAVVDTERPYRAARVSERYSDFDHGLLGDAVRLRLRADVPIALFLSGGVDSSIIAAECVRQQAELPAFTVSFDGNETDLPYARRVAAALKLRHEVLRVGCGEVESMTRHYDEPFADSSALPSLALAGALKDRYKVVLTGDGGDEAFGGYRHYEHIRAKQVLKAAAAAAGLRDGRASDPMQIYVQSKATFRAAEREQMLNGNGDGNSLASLLDHDPYLQQRPGSALKRALWSDRHLYLPNDLTYKMDIALASAGIEGRAPFLDHRLLEWAQTLPPRELVRGRQKKVLLRAAFRGELPDDVLDRPKQGFGAPVGEWLRGPLRDLAHDMVPSPLLDPQAQQGVTGQRLWTLLAFSSWARQWRATW